MPDPQEHTLDIEQAAADIGADLGFSSDEPDTDIPVDDTPIEESSTEDVPQEPLSGRERDEQGRFTQKAEAAPVAVDLDTPPQSWAKEKHGIWATMAPEAREYFKQREDQMLSGLEQYKQYAGYGRHMAEAFKPYQGLLKQQGVDEVKAVQYLLSAHNKLSDQDEGKRTEYFRELAGLYGVKWPQNEAQNPQNDQYTPLINEIKGIKSELNTWRQREYQTVQAKVESEVEAFSKDPAHPYFDEVGDEIAKLINVGYTLPEAYERAVWANPLTRQKELARVQTEQAQQLQAKRKEEAEKARRAVSGNVRSRDTSKAPTEPLGSMEDTMRETLANLKSARTH